MAFRHEIEALSGQNVNLCFQCSKCSAGCPLAGMMDLKPAQVMHSIRLGREDSVLHSTAIWLCLGCEACATGDFHPPRPCLLAVAKSSKLYQDNQGAGAMHESGLTEDLLTHALQHAREAHARRIVRLRVTIGALSDATPDSVRFYFEALAPGTLAEGAVLEFDTAPGRAHCRACGQDVTVGELFAPCPACGQHPDYMATRYARARAESQGLRLVTVQHHHAHIAACMAENAHTGDRSVIGVACDGTGYGSDGAIWGGEFLIADYAGFERAAHLAYVPLPGGDAGTRKPARVALAHLLAAGLPPDPDLPPVAALSATERRIVEKQIATGLNSPPTSSMGRLFDAVASIIGLRQEVNYEGQEL